MTAISFDWWVRFKCGFNLNDGYGFILMKVQFYLSLFEWYTRFYFDGFCLGLMRIGIDLLIWPSETPLHAHLNPHRPIYLNQIKSIWYARLHFHITFCFSFGFNFGWRSVTKIIPIFVLRILLCINLFSRLLSEKLSHILIAFFVHIFYAFYSQTKAIYLIKPTPKPFIPILQMRLNIALITPYSAPL